MATPPNPVRLRPATAEDVEELSTVAHASFHDAFATIMSPAGLETRSLDFFRQKFAQDWRVVLLAVIGKRIVGFSLVRARHIEMLFVAPRSQGQGVGLALLGAAESNGAVSLECFALNHRARAFYERARWRLTRSYAREFAGDSYDFVLYSAPVPL
jgi:ribosomal protein S18 acetylase RimI-like enzyme